MPAAVAAKPGMDRQSQRLRQRADGRFRQDPDRPAHHGDRRRRSHGLLAARRPALLLLRVPAVPYRGPLFLLRPRPDLPEPAVSAGGDLARDDRRHDPAATDYPANGTIFDELDAHGISWKDYFSTTASTELFPQLYLRNAGTKVVPIAGFFTDAGAGTLPGYCIVEPDYGNQSEENPQNIAVGEEFTASVINAVINGPAWDRTALLLTYDEHGGYYDHVPPPSAIPPDNIGPILVPGENGFDGFARYGFRVPFALISPWARRHFVSHRVYDHTSILKLVETKWNLPALTYRDANAAPMLDMLDLRRPSFAKPPELAQPLAVTDPSALSCSVAGPGTIPPPGSVTG